MQIRMSRDAPRWIWTEGLEALGQQELVAFLPWPEDDARDEQVIALLRFLEEYILRQPRRIVAGETLEVGWSRLRFVAEEQGQRLVLEELRDDAPGEPVYVPGVARTIALKRLQDEALRRYGLTGHAEQSQRSKTAVACNLVTPQTIRTLRPLQVQRLWEPDDTSSGWFVGCHEGGHDHHDAAEVEQVHLAHLVAGFPGLFPYLALPVQTALVFEAAQVIVFRPGEQEGYVDPEPLLRELP